MPESSHRDRGTAGDATCHRSGGDHNGWEPATWSSRITDGDLDADGPVAVV
jgi:hypothetical protein